MRVVERTTDENKALRKVQKNRFFIFKNRNLKNVCLVLRDYTFRYQWSLTVLDGTFANMTILI